LKDELLRPGVTRRGFLFEKKFTIYLLFIVKYQFELTSINTPVTSALIHTPIDIFFLSPYD